MHAKKIVPRSLRLLCLCWLLALTSTRCGPSDEASAPAALAPATIRWITWESSSQAEQTLMQQFRVDNPQIEFQRTTLDFAIRNALRETPPPDLINVDMEYDFDELIRQNQLADLTELWAQTGLHEQVPPPLQRLSERDGKQHYIPFGFGWVGFYYNKQIFATYNLQPPQTWDEFLQLCETLVINGETPLAIAGNEPWSNYAWFEYIDLRLNGPEFHRDLLQGKERFEDVRVRNSLERWKALFDQGYFIQEPQLMSGMNTVLTLVRAERAKALTREKAVMALSDAYTVSQIPSLFLNELGFFRFPIMDPAIPTVEIVDAFGYVIPVGADHSAQALAFLTHVSSAKSQVIVAQQGLFSSVTYAPARMDVDPAGLRFDQRGAMEMIKTADELVPFMWLTLPDETWGMMSYHFDRFVRQHEVDPFITKLEEAMQAGKKKGLFREE
jgi:ABC-type glycerol-3-phosphate transport system substrate-binding protein